MQFERFLNLIEDTTDASPTDVTGKLLRFPVTQKINVKFRTKQLQSLSKRQCKLPRILINVAGYQMCGQEFTQDWAVVRGSEGNAFINDNGFKVAVKNGPKNGVFEIAGKNRFVDELVLGPAQSA